MLDTVKPEHDLRQLDKDLDRTKANVFTSSDAAFFGSLLCSLGFQWDTSIDTAATDGNSIFWAPDYFLKLPRGSRKTDLMHELWHVAELDMLRQGSRDHRLWNIACDIRIDLRLEAQGYTFDKIEGVLTWPDLNARQYKDWVAEDIYDALVKNPPPPPPSYQPDLKPGPPGATMKTVQAVIKAIQQAKMTGAGTLPGDIEQIISKFLKPKVPWEQVLGQWMSDLLEDAYTWARPNRRYQDMYLPSRYQDEGRLAHLNYYEDTSGSISDEDCVQFNSEFKYVKERFNPAKMSLIQFDTRISFEQDYLDSDPFNQVKVVGRGGTSLMPVREHIIRTKPTAAIIFSDLECEPMAPLPFNIPVLWVCIRNERATVPFGRLIHIR